MRLPRFAISTRVKGRKCALVADFVTGYAIDRRSYAVENDDRALCVLQDRLIFFVELVADLKVEIFARLSAPFDLALAVVVGFDPLFSLEKSASASFTVSLASSPALPPP